MKIFVTGGSGMLGSYVASQAVEAGHDVWATYSAHPVELEGCNMMALDLAKSDDVMSAIDSIRPDAIIHTAAIVFPDVCENNKQLAWAANVTGTANVSAAAKAVGAHIVYISTDLAFDGSKNPIREHDQICPPNYYGKTKAAGEMVLDASGANAAIVRTSVIYGPRKFPHLNSFSDKIINTLREGKTLGAFVDQYRPAVPVWNLAEAVLEIADRRLKGIYHVVCPEVSTRYQFARRVAEIQGLNANLIEPIYMDESTAAAPRPKMLVLDTTETAKTLNTRLLSFEEGIRGLTL